MAFGSWLKKTERGGGVKVSRRFSYRLDKTRAYFFLDVFNAKIHDSS